MTGAWKPQLETGISEIDAQHKELFEAVETIGAALATHSAGEAERALDWLAGYVLKHFECEERWMRENRFPLRREHIAKHDYFITNLAAMNKDFGEEGASAVLKLRLRNALAWLEDHIEDYDRDLGKHLKAMSRDAAPSSLRTGGEAPKVNAEERSAVLLAFVRGGR